jgi:hypothetical protein
LFCVEREAIVSAEERREEDEGTKAIRERKKGAKG